MKTVFVDGVCGPVDNDGFYVLKEFVKYVVVKDDKIQIILKNTNKEFNEKDIIFGGKNNGK